MIKENELRIGNWINPEKPYQVNANTFQDVFNGEFDQDGIPLTEEWLLKFGFEKTGVFWFSKKVWINELNINIKHRAYTIGSVNGDEALFECENIDYVHQLQNLYFALTGEELTIKQDAPA